MKLKAISFGLVGVVNTFIDLGVFSIAWIFFGLSPLLANLVAWFLAVSGSYFINCFTTFAAESGRGSRCAHMRASLEPASQVWW